MKPDLFCSPFCDTRHEVHLSQLELHLKNGNVMSASAQTQFLPVFTAFQSEKIKHIYGINAIYATTTVRRLEYILPNRISVCCLAVYLKPCNRCRKSYKYDFSLTCPMTSRLLNEEELFFTDTLRRLNLISSLGRSYSNL